MRAAHGAPRRRPPQGGGLRGVGRGKNVRRVLPPRSAAPIPGRASKARREPGPGSSRPPGASPAKGPPLAGAGVQGRARAGRGAEPPKTEATSSGAEKEADGKTDRPSSAAERGDSPPARRRTTSLLRVAQNSSNLPLKKIIQSRRRGRGQQLAPPARRQLRERRLQAPGRYHVGGWPPFKCGATGAATTEKRTSRRTGAVPPRRRPPQGGGGAGPGPQSPARPPTQARRARRAGTRRARKRAECGGDTFVSLQNLVFHRAPHGAAAARIRVQSASARFFRPVKGRTYPPRRSAPYGAARRRRTCAAST